MATIHDVARHAGVSAATVSRVLNGRETVDPALAVRVQSAVSALGYRRNSVARNLRRRQTTLWAVLISDIENPFFTSLVRGVEDVGRSEGYSVVLCNTDEDTTKESEYIAACLADKMAGVIISPTSDTSDVSPLIEAGTAVVAIDRELSQVTIDTVLVDNEGGAEQATRHLAERGYQRIACITGPRRTSTAIRRLRGYQRAIKATGLAADKSLIRHADYREAGGYAAMAALLDEDVRPDAVFAANNLMTVGALECLVDRGMSVPDEVGVVGFDDIPWARLARPSLTTVGQPTYEMGKSAAQLLAGRIATPGRPATRVTLHTELHIRDSSSRPTS